MGISWATNRVFFEERNSPVNLFFGRQSPPLFSQNIAGLERAGQAGFEPLGKPLGRFRIAIERRQIDPPGVFLEVLAPGRGSPGTGQGNQAGRRAGYDLD